MAYGQSGSLNAANTAAYQQNHANEAMAKQQAYANLAAQQACDAPPPRPCSELDTVCNRFAQVIDIANQHGAMLDRICEKLYGPRPCSPETKGGAITTGGTLSLMHAGLDTAVSRLHENGELIIKISQAI